MADLHELSLLDLRDAVARHDLGRGEAVEHSLARIEKFDHEINAFVETREAAVDEAVDANGPLAGVPIAVKDMFVDNDRIPTVGSRATGSWMKGTAAVIDRLRKAGAAIVGYANLHEWGVGMTSSITATGPIHNPWDLTRATGGSSGGSAAALAAGFVPGAIGTDAGGSIRCPAACCQVVGLKPTWGRVSMDGFVEGWSELDHVGPMARSVADVRSLFEVLIDEPLGAIDTHSLRIGVGRRHFFENIAPEVARAVDDGIGSLRSEVASIEEVDVAHAELASYAVGLLLLPLTAELLKDSLDDPELFDPYTYRVLRLGAALGAQKRTCGRPHHKLIMESRRRLSTSRYLDFPDLPRPLRGWVGRHLMNAEQGKFARRFVTEGWERAFERVDAVMVPTLPVVPPPEIGGQVELPSKPVSSDIAYLPMMGPMNLAGVPALSVPCGETSGGWAVSLQIVARKGRDDAVLALGEALERALDHRYTNRIAPL